MSLSLKPIRSLLLEMLFPLDRLPRRVGNSAADSPPASSENSHGSLYGAWLASRTVPASKGVMLAPGAQRPLSRDNITLAAFIARQSSLDILSLIWQLYPLRVLAMVAMDVCKGVFPAFRGYSQALIINEVRRLL